MSSTLLAAPWAQFWQVTLLVVIVAVLVRTMARNRPHLAYVLWLVVLVKCVMPPFWSSPSGVFCWLQPSQEGPTSTLSVEIGRRFNEPLKAEQAAMASRIYARSSEPLATMGVEPAMKRPQRWLARGLAIWAIGAAISLLLAAWRWQRCLRKARQGGIEPSADLTELIQALRRRLGLRLPVRVILTQGRLGPAVTGVFRPTLLLPEGILRDKKLAEIEPILVHELLHIRRGDLWAGLLQTVVLAVWWFHPLVRWAVRQAMCEAERCCDEAVLAELPCQPKEYARGLLDVLQYRTNWTPAPAFPGAGRVEATATRLERIMRLGQGCRRRSPWWCWLVMLAAAAVVLPGGAFVLSGDEPDAPLPLGVVLHVAPPAAQRQPLATFSQIAPPDAKRTPFQDEQALLVQVQTPGERAPSNSAALPEVLRGYALEDLIQATCMKDGMNVSQVKDHLAWQIDALLRSRSQPRGATTWPVSWSDDRMLVRATAREHDEVAKSLEAIRAHGLAQLTVSVGFAAGSPEIYSSLDIQWTVMPNKDGDEDNPLGLVPSWNLANGGNLAAAHSSVLQPPFSTPATVLPTTLERPLPTQDTAHHGHVRHVKHTPMRFAILDQDKTDMVMNQLQGDARSNILQAPRVTVFNGQSAFVSDTSQQPFVVSVKPVKGEQETANEPVISVVDEGTRLGFRPVLREDNEVWLDYNVIMTAIHEVNTFQFSGEGSDEPITVQLPVVETMQVEGANGMPLGSTLVIAGLERPRKQRKEAGKSMFSRLADSLFGANEAGDRTAPEKTSLMLLLRVEKVFPNLPAAKADASEVGMVSR